MSEARPQPVISGAAVMSAGLASTVAAAITSRFGVAGTIFGAGITAMLVTGGAAVLRSYMESAAGKMREAPSRFKERTAQRKQDMARFGGNGSSRSGFFGRFSHALGWFSRLPAMNRSSVLKRGLWGALAALVVGLVFITVTEFVIGNSLSCGFWGKCQAGATPGLHLSGADRAVNGAGPSVTLGQPKANNVTPGVAGEQVPGSGGVFGGGGEQPSSSTSTSTASPQAAPEESPSTASPEAAPQESPSSASPQAEPQVAPQGSPSSATPQAAPAE